MTSNQDALTALAARPGGRRNINDDRHLTDEQRITIFQMIEKAMRVNKPSATVTAEIVPKVFRLVFAPQWFSRWPPISPIEKERRIEDTSLQVGVWRRDLPAQTRGDEVESNSITDNEGETTTATPRKRARMRASGTSALLERKKSAPAFLRPMLRDCGILDVWFTDARGRRAADNCVKYFDGGDKLSGDVIARAVLHYDANEIQRIKTYNQALLVYLIRRYIYKLATGQNVGGEDATYKYNKPILVSQGLEGMRTAMEALQRTSEGREVEVNLLD